MVCVPENQCDLKGVNRGRALEISDQTKMFRVALQVRSLAMLKLIIVVI